MTTTDRTCAIHYPGIEYPDYVYMSEKDDPVNFLRELIAENQNDASLIRVEVVNVADTGDEDHIRYHWTFDCPHQIVHTLNGREVDDSIPARP